MQLKSWSLREWMVLFFPCLIMLPMVDACGWYQLGGGFVCALRTASRLE